MTDLTTIYGNTIKSGVVIAVAAVIDPLLGINNVSPALLEEGVAALKKGLNANEYPEAIIVAENLAIASAVVIPGIRACGYAVESEISIPGYEPNLPTISGLENITGLVSEGDIIILDAKKGVAYIDPDLNTVIEYQQAELKRQEKGRIFITSEHLPARTQKGETILVYARVKDNNTVDLALDNGADGLFVDIRDIAKLDLDYIKRVLVAGLGKPIIFAVDTDATELVLAAAELAGPGQVTIMFDNEKFDDRFEEIEPALCEIDMNADSADVNISILSKSFDFDIEKLPIHCSVALEVFNAESVQDHVREFIKKIARERDPIHANFVLGNALGALPVMVKAGVRCITVDPNDIQKAKYMIREIGMEEID